MTENGSGEHNADGSKTITSNAALREIAANFMATATARFTETCEKFGISEGVARSLLAKTLLLDEPANAGAFEVAWSDIYDATVATTEAAHNVTVEADCYYVDVLSNDTGDSVLCMWGDSVADDTPD